MANSVNTPVDKYNELNNDWQKCRDGIAGQRAVKKRGEEYLPKLSGQSEKSYENYLHNALWYNASGRTFEGYEGLVFRKDPDINADSIEDFVEDCTLSGKSLKEFARDAVKEELKTSRFGVLVDHPDMNNSDLSQAEAEARGNRPYLVPYKAEDILEAKTQRIGARTKLARVRLRENVSESTDDEFKDDSITQVRVLDLEDGKKYRQRVFRKSEKDGWHEMMDMRQYPRMNGKYIDEIPFYITGGYDFREPRLIDLINVNFTHYVKDADHSAGVARTTRPQHYATGVPDEDMPDELILGGEQFWNFPPEGAEVGILSLDSDLVASTKYIESLEERMANLGARMLLPDGPSSAETATEFVIKKQGENSALGNVSKLVGELLTKASQFAAEWQGENPDDISVKLNMDFIPVNATPDDVLKMIQAVQSGEYLPDDYDWWLQQNEMVDPSIGQEERRSKLETEPPTGL